MNKSVEYYTEMYSQQLAEILESPLRCQKLLASKGIIKEVDIENYKLFIKNMVIERYKLDNHIFN